MSEWPYDALDAENIQQYERNLRDRHERTAEIERANLAAIGADMAELMDENTRLRRENQHLRDSICKILGKSFVAMVDDSKAVWR